MKKEESWIEEMIKISTIIIIIWGMFFIGYIFVSKEIGFYLTSIPSIPKGDILALSQLAQIGDAFNILTSLFAGLAFAAVIVTIKVQQNELVETRKEFKKQREIMDIQQFDNKFFQMLDLFIRISNDIKISDIFKSNSSFIVILVKSENLNDFQTKYEEWSYIYPEAGHYFWNLYQLLKYIDNDFPVEQEKNKYQYIDIIRAQLSQNHLAMLFYNCLGIIKVSEEHYKKLIEKYKLLKHLRYESLFLKISVKDKMKPLISELIQEYNIEALSQSIIDKREIEDKSLF